MSRFFNVVVERDLETKWLAANVIELPGCYTQARDFVELEQNLREAISLYLDSEEEIEFDAEYGTGFDKEERFGLSLRTISE